MMHLLTKSLIVWLAVLLVFSLPGAPAVHAQSSMVHVPLSPPTGWSDVTLAGIWGSSGSDVYMVGNGVSPEPGFGPVFYHNGGTGWTHITPPLPVGLGGGSLNAIWGLNTRELYAVGYGSNGSPLVFHNNGAGWTGESLPLLDSLGSGWLSDVWGDSTGRVYAVGVGFTTEISNREKPLLYQHDGSGWTGTVLPLPAGWVTGTLYAVWGSGPGDVYLGGIAYTEPFVGNYALPLLYHNDGSGWAYSILFPPALVSPILGIWGSGPGDVYLAGDIDGYRPLLLHKEGTDWVQPSILVPDGAYKTSFDRIWGSGPNDLYATGTASVYDGEERYLPVYYHNDGSGWMRTPLAIPEAFSEGFTRAVGGSGTGDVYLGGTGFLAVDGKAMPLLYRQSTPGVTVFSDVGTAYWAREFIERLYAAGITGGCASGPLRYCPEDSVTRAQMAVFLLRGIHTSSYSPPAVGGSTDFSDVPPDYWAASFIKQLAAEGITSGCGGGNYCPEQAVTRAQMAVFLLRSKYGVSYTPPDVGATTGFGDVPPDYWAAAFIKQLVTEGITAGCGSGNYCPEQPVTRAQMAVFLVRTFSLP